MNFNNATALIFANDNKGVERFLVIINNNNLLNIPGGRRDRTDKNSYETSLRETAEETSDNGTKTVDLSSLTYLWQFANNHDNGTVTHVNCYRSSAIVSARTTHIKNSEVKAISWMRADYVRALVKNGKLNITDDLDLLGRQYKMFSPCVGTFKKMHAAGLI